MQKSDSTAHDAALAYLFGRIDYERASSIPYSSAELRLDRMRELLHRLGNPQQRMKIVHVAGTKGKGSTSAMIASILTAAGYRTGLYSSPHLERLEERMRVDGKLCSGEQLVDLVANLHPVVAAMDAAAGTDQRFPSGPTYFELTTAMALLHFAEEGVDAAVLEVGLGGRLDSTNVCQPAVTVITSISFDHMEQLGYTLSAIAREKAGIAKLGVPMISGVVADEPRETIAETCRAQGSPLIQLGVDFDFTYQAPQDIETVASSGSISFVSRQPGAEFERDGMLVGLLGRHQGANGAVALMTCLELRRQGWAIPDDVLQTGLASVAWPARVEVLSQHPIVVLDTAHNVASVAALVSTLEESFGTRRRVLIFATTLGKDVRGMLQSLLPAFDEVILTQYRTNPRRLPVEALVQAAGEVTDKRPHVAHNAPEAWAIAQDLAGEHDLICITGSFFLAAEVRPLIDAWSAYRRVSASPLLGQGSFGAGPLGSVTAPPNDGGASARGL